MGVGAEPPDARKILQKFIEIFHVKLPIFNHFLKSLKFFAQIWSKR